MPDISYVIHLVIHYKLADLCVSVEPMARSALCGKTSDSQLCRKKKSDKTMVFTIPMANTATPKVTI